MVGILEVVYNLGMQHTLNRRINIYVIRNKIAQNEVVIAEDRYYILCEVEDYRQGRSQIAIEARFINSGKDCLLKGVS